MRKDIFYTTTPSNSFGFHFKWKFVPVEGAQELGVKLQVIREREERCLGAEDGLTYVAKNQQRKVWDQTGGV